MPQAQAFLDEQVRLTTQLLDIARTELAPQDPQLLQQRPAPDRWSVLDCLDHLNRYGRFYLPRSHPTCTTVGWAATSSAP